MEKHEEKQVSIIANVAGSCDNDMLSGNEEDLLITEEIVIEEMAIDGICGVY